MLGIFGKRVFVYLENVYLYIWEKCVCIFGKRVFVYLENVYLCIWEKCVCIFGKRVFEIILRYTPRNGKYTMTYFI